MNLLRMEIFLSEEQCDFIFAVVGEELGFAGSAFIILIYLLLFIEGLRVAGRSPDLEGKLLASGFVTIFVNPVFYQYGSSHAASSKYGNTASIYQRRNEFTDKHVIFMMGIMLNISMHRKMKVF